MKHSLFLLPLLLALTGAADPQPSTSASNKPTDEEWAKAERLALPRHHPMCGASQVREWVRVACKTDHAQLMGARVVAGATDDVSVAGALSIPKDEKNWSRVDVIFAARRGDRRLIEIPRAFFPGFKSYSIEEDAAVMISELWLPGDASPTITVH